MILGMVQRRNENSDHLAFITKYDICKQSISFVSIFIIMMLAYYNRSILLFKHTKKEAETNEDYRVSVQEKSTSIDTCGQKVTNHAYFLWIYISIELLSKML